MGYYNTENVHVWIYEVQWINTFSDDIHTYTEHFDTQYSYIVPQVWFASFKMLKMTVSNYSLGAAMLHI